jgi:hypothetical protein
MRSSQVSGGEIVANDTRNEIDKFKVYESSIIMFMKGWIDDIVCISS